MHTSFRFKSVLALIALCLLMGMGMNARVAAQDDATATSPIVGVWTIPPTAENSGSIISLSSDGGVVDSETDGMWGMGAWEATGPESGVMTFAFLLHEPVDDFTGSIIIRATLTYDAATDTVTASYTVTGALQDGTVIFTDEEPVDVTLTRLPAQGIDHTGEPIDGLTGAPAATPTA